MLSVFILQDVRFIITSRNVKNNETRAILAQDDVGKQCAQSRHPFLHLFPVVELDCFRKNTKRFILDKVKVHFLVVVLKKILKTTFQ